MTPARTITLHAARDGGYIVAQYRPKPDLVIIEFAGSLEECFAFIRGTLLAPLE